jgi:hypothetical protein
LRISEVYEHIQVSLPLEYSWPILRGELTGNPGRDQLHGVDDLRIETGSHLDAHAARKQHEVQVSQIPLPVPWDRILHRHAVDNVVPWSYGDANHDVGFVQEPDDEEQ